MIDHCLDPEIELLLFCARVTMDATAQLSAKTLASEGMDWDKLEKAARQHRVIPLLFHSLNSVCPSAVPKVFMDRLRDHFRNNALLNLFLGGELATLLRVLEANGIPALPLKGPVLAASVYGDLTLRHAGDLDILVRKQDALRSKIILTSLRYMSMHESPKEGEQHHFSLIDTKHRVVVEIHWDLLNPWFFFYHGMNSDEIMNNSDYIDFLGIPTRFMPLQDLTMYLCAHGTKHGWECLSWICDIAELVRVHQGAEWDWVLGRARTLGTERMVSLGLFLASDLLGASSQSEWSRE
jgi:hypothetical protein